MHFLLIHSPLVTKQIWLELARSLEIAGFKAAVVALDNQADQGSRFFEHHIAQIESSLRALNNEKAIAVAHSGAGNLLALLDPNRFEGHIFLDAIFPSEKSSRFDLFDEPEARKNWQEIADQHGGMLPRSMLAGFGGQIENVDTRSAFVEELTDAPIELYTETIPIHPHWPSSKRGLYVQWTDTYSLDAARAEAAGFDVRTDPASHFNMLNKPDEVARELTRFAREKV